MEAIKYKHDELYLFLCPHSPSAVAGKPRTKCIAQLL